MKAKAVRVLVLACCIVVLPVSAEIGADAAGNGGSKQLSRAVELGSKTHVMRRTGKDALHWAAFYGNVSAVENLIVSGVDINRRIKKGATPLHLAAYNGHVGVVKLLIDHGAKVNARTREGITPLGWAQRNGHTQVVNLLTARGGKVGRAPPAGIVLPERQGSVKQQPPQPVPKRRRAPLKYGLMRVPESTFAKMEAEDKAASQTERVKQKKPKGAYRVQLAAVASGQHATKAWSGFRNSYPDVLAGLALIVDKSLVKGKTYYRVQAGPMSRSEARSICERLKQSDQPCLVVGSGSS